MTNVDININAELERFKTVFSKRKSVAEQIDLFYRLEESNKFHPLAKPTCYKFLIQTLAVSVPDAKLNDLFAAMQATLAGRHIRDDFTEEEADVAMGRLTWRLFERCKKDVKSLLALGNQIVDAGIAFDYSHAATMASLVGMPEPLLEVVLDTTFKERYYFTA